jgi:hypothetical protein
MPQIREIFKEAEQAKNAIMLAQYREIKSLFSEWAEEITHFANAYEHQQAHSEVVLHQQYRDLENRMLAANRDTSDEIEDIVIENTYKMSEAVVNSHNRWLVSLGFGAAIVSASTPNIPDRTVQRLLTGQVDPGGWERAQSILTEGSKKKIAAIAERRYAAGQIPKEQLSSTLSALKVPRDPTARVFRTDWTLSKSIWTDSQKTNRMIQDIVAGGIAEGKPAYQIARDIEKWVNPDKALPWNLKMSDGRRIYPRQIDYNAQRLARTMAQHSYQISFFESIKNDNSIDGYIWVANGSRPCPFCLANNGKFYPKEEWVLDHPNGMCTMVPHTVDRWKEKLSEMLLD